MSISDEGFGVYSALRVLYNTDIPIQYINLNLIAFVLTNKKSFTRNFLVSLKNGINELINLGIINLNGLISQDEYIIDLSPIYFKTSKVSEGEEQTYYSMITLDEIQKCINGRTTFKFKLLRYFTYLIGTFRGDVGFQSIEEMSDNLQYDDDAIMRNNQLLEKLKLIYVYKADDYIVSTTENANQIIWSINNTYGRYSDKEEIVLAGKQFAIDYGFKHKTDQKQISKKMSNQTKSYVMKYNQFCKGHIYDNETLKEIYNAIIEYNKKYDYKKKDLSMFKDYAFYVDSMGGDTS